MPQITNAQVFISEIMYDLEGTDGGREWIEIFNDSSQSVDLSTYYLYENNTAHKINFVSGNNILNSQSFAIIADNSDKFLLDFPSFEGNLFDSAFSLSNSGEELVLLDQDKIEVDFTNYNPEMGANGTGNSLQYFESIFIPGEPTPNFENVTEPANETENTSENTNDDNLNTIESTHSGQNELVDYKPNVRVRTGIGRDRVVSINSPVDFEIYMSDKDSGNHFWNFGDGESERGEKVSHVYKKQGEYNVILNSVFGDYKNTSRVKVVVNQVDIEVNQFDDFIELKNVGDYELNLGDFVLEIDGEEKKILKDTIISKGQSYIFELENKSKKIVLKYPNSKIYFSSLNEKAKDFCQKAITYGLNCNVEKIQEIFDRI